MVVVPASKEGAGGRSALSKGDRGGGVGKGRCGGGIGGGAGIDPEAGGVTF